MELLGKVAMVTGCARERGFGRAIARRLAAEGADMVVTDISERGTEDEQREPRWGGLAALAEEIRQMKRRTICATLDVRSSPHIDAVVTRAVTMLGGIDILVNNAAAPPGADRVSVVDLAESAWDMVLDTNLKGTYLCSKAIVTLMLERKVPGRIINIASDLGKVGVANRAAYCASKFGIIGFTQALAMEVAHAAITVNAICPGLADTDRTDFLARRPDGEYNWQLKTDAIKRASAAIPLKRLVSPEEVAELAAFLASERAAYITGQSINLSGGLIMH